MIGASLAVASLSIQAGFSGTLTQSAALTVNGNFSKAAGTFTGGTNAITILGNLTQTGGTFTSTSTTLSISGSYLNTGTFTANSGLVAFTATTSGKTLSGSMIGASAFYKLSFNGTNGNWTIGRPVTVSALNATGALVIGNGTVTLDGSGTTLEVDGKTTIAATANQRGTLQTTALPHGQTITIDVNNNAVPASCPNCILDVGAGSGTGSLKLPRALSQTRRLGGVSGGQFRWESVSSRNGLFDRPRGSASPCPRSPNALPARSSFSSGNTVKSPRRHVSGANRGKPCIVRPRR